MIQAITHQSILLPDDGRVTFKITNHESSTTPRATLWIDTGTYHGMQITFCDPSTLKALRDALNSADANAFLSSLVLTSA